MEVSTVIQSLDELPLQPCLLIDPLHFSVFPKCRVITADSSKCCGLSLPPVRFFFRQATFVSNFEGTIEIGKCVLDVSAPREAQSHIAQVETRCRFQSQAFADFECLLVVRQRFMESAHQQVDPSD